MSLNRCAACGSSNVITDTKSEGIKFNYVKGAIGTVVFGAGGAVAGLSNKSIEVYKCSDCGIELTYSMPQNLKTAIDIGVISEEARKTLYVEGYGQLSWCILRQIYKNIEEGPADRAIARRSEELEYSMSSYSTATHEEFDSAVDTIVDFERRLSCNGSIYDQLPEDAFTDKNPMTLVEFHMWQDAINTFVENMTKYLPTPLPEIYRGLSSYNMKGYFLTYLYEKIKLEFGHYPELSDYKHSDDFQKYAEINPYVVDLANKYFVKSVMAFGTLDRYADLWTAEKMSDIMRDRSFMFGSPTMITVVFDFKKYANKDIKITHHIPRYTVEEGRLALWEGSNPKGNIISGDDLIKYYFAIFPEKEKEFNKKISSQKKEKSKKNDAKRQLNILKSTVKEKQQQVKEKQLEIDKLQKKIFGKAKANAKAVELLSEISKIQPEIWRIQGEIIELSELIETPDNDDAFYYQLIKEMDYFIIWMWTDEASEKLGNSTLSLAKQKENRDINDAILEFMQSKGDWITIMDIFNGVEEAQMCSRQRIEALLRVLACQDKIAKKTIGEESQYKII